MNPAAYRNGSDDTKTPELTLDALFKELSSGRGELTAHKS
jgi:hypothetical protein